MRAIVLTLSVVLGPAALPGPASAVEDPPPPVVGSANAVPAPAVAMTPAQVETVLRARGYDRFEGLVRAEDGSYRLAAAERFGSSVGPLRIDAATGAVLDEAPLGEAQVRALLHARGYAEVPEIRTGGGAIFARAQREGREVALRVDPRTGVVRPWQD